MSDRRILDTGTEDLQAHVEDRVAVLTMNRPKARNALSGEMLGALAGCLAEVETSPDVACIVLTGAGGAFCAGGDVKGMAASNEERGASGRRATLDEAIHHVHTSLTHDHRNAVKAFVEKRKPEFEGR